MYKMLLKNSFGGVENLQFSPLYAVNFNIEDTQ